MNDTARAEFEHILRNRTYDKHAYDEETFGELLDDLAEAHAARVGAARADAWDEGFDAGERDVFEHERGSYDDPCIPNPYRAAVAVPEPEEGDHG